MAEIDDDPIYWRVIYCREKQCYVSVCLQSFDEIDYDQSQFLNKEKYTTEEEADAACRTVQFILSGGSGATTGKGLNECENLRLYGMWNDSGWMVTRDGAVISSYDRRNIAATFTGTPHGFRVMEIGFDGKPIEL